MYLEITKTTNIAYKKAKDVYTFTIIYKDLKISNYF